MVKNLIASKLFFISFILSFFLNSFETYAFEEINDMQSFEGTVIYGKSSGTLIKIEGKNYKNAIAMTNGHSAHINYLRGYSISNKESNELFTLVDRNGTKVAKLKARRLIYSTMIHTDVAFFELDQTYEYIETKYGIRPRIISKVGANIGEDIAIISSSLLTNEQCSVENIVPLIREMNWKWKDSLRYTNRCKGIGGMSGAPIISLETFKIVGLHNTSAQQKVPCSMGAPCEILRNGEVGGYEKGVSYGQNIHWIYDCLSEDSKYLNFNFKNEKCKLVGPNDSI